MQTSTKTHSEGALTRYVLREHACGRQLREILADPYVRNRCSPEQVERLLDDPAVVHAVGEDDIAALRLDLGAAAHRALLP
jgi:hypothetical protein